MHWAIMETLSKEHGVMLRSIGSRHGMGTGVHLFIRQKPDGNTNYVGNNQDEASNYSKESCPHRRRLPNDVNNFFGISDISFLISARRLLQAIQTGLRLTRHGMRASPALVAILTFTIAGKEAVLSSYQAPHANTSPVRNMITV